MCDAAFDVDNGQYKDLKTSEARWAIADSFLDFIMEPNNIDNVMCPCCSDTVIKQSSSIAQKSSDQLIKTADRCKEVALKNEKAGGSDGGLSEIKKQLELFENLRADAQGIIFFKLYKKR